MILREAGPGDIFAVARLHRYVVRISLDFLPSLHTPQEDLAYFRDEIFPSCSVWVAEADAAIVGYIAFKPDFVEDLYVHPGHQDRRLGVALLDKAKAGATELSLWTFQANAKARRFYEREGFRAIQFTDGERNEEGEPDVLYRWTRSPQGV